MDQKEIGRIFYRDGYALANQHLEEEISAFNLTAAISQLHRVVDELLDSFLKRSEQEGRAAECKLGCTWCCHQAVFAVTHEFLYLNKYIQQHLSEELRNKALEKAREKVLRTHNQPLETQLQMKIACPFLQSGSCMVYEARPMACRIYLSSSEMACRAEFDEPANDRNIPELFEFPLQAGRMLNQGFVAYLKQRGFKVSELPLEQGYSTMVTLGQTMEDWIESGPG